MNQLLFVAELEGRTGSLLPQKICEFCSIFIDSLLIILFERGVTVDGHDDCAIETKIHGVDIFDFLGFGLVVGANLFVGECIFKVVVPFLFEFFF